MTFCFFTTQYLPTPGGVERYTWNLARRCLAAGHRALVVTSSLPGLPARETDADGIEIWRLPAWPVMNGRFPVLKPRPPAADLWAQGIDFAVIQTRMYTQSVWAARQCKRRGIPALVLDHSTGYMMHGGAAGLAGKMYEHLACNIIKACGFPFYGVSGDVCSWLRTFGITAAGRLPNAVDPAELAQLASDHPRDFRAEFDLAPATPIIAFVGRLIPEKGAAKLAEAVRQLNQNGTSCALFIAGTGPEENALRQLGAPIYALGALPHPQIVQLLTQASCYCLPTEYAEGFPTTLLEAAACRCPIVTTHTAGTGELLPDGTYAAYLESTAPAALAAALQAVLADPDAARTRATPLTPTCAPTLHGRPSLLQWRKPRPKQPKGAKMSKLLIVIPAYNEEESIVSVVEELTTHYPQYDYVVVNDGSRDKTAAICRAHGYRLIDLPVNLGLAGAFQTGLRYAAENDYDCAMQLDADGQHKPEFIAPMLEALEEGNDIVIGSRFLTVKKPKTLRMLGSYIISWSIRLTTGRAICDPTSGMRMFNRRLMQEFAQNLNYGPEPDTISYLIKNGAKVKEVQVEMGERTAGQSYLTFWRSVQYMVKMSISILLIQWFRKRDTATPYPERSL